MKKSSADLIFEALEGQAEALFVADVLHGGANPLPKKLRPGPESENWIQADNKEREALESMGCWEKVNLKDVPKGTNIIPSCMLYDKKRDGRYKARLVARGDRQVDDPDPERHFDPYSPTISFTSLRMLIAHAVSTGRSVKQCDISNAFINASLKKSDGTFHEEVYMKLPLHWGGDYVRLLRSLYGLRTAPKHWYLCLTNSLVNELGYERTDSDPGLFSKTIDGERVLIGVYVDDIVVVASDAVATRARDQILARWA
eukprot:gene503-biopygen433